MDCPACAEPMVVLEFEDVEVDFCLSCKGIWLDAGELQLLFGDEASCAAYLSIGEGDPARGEQVRKCPICGRKMLKDATASVPPVTFDRCARDHGIWLDEGELETMLHQGAGAAEAVRVAGFLREVFTPDEGGHV